MTEPGKTDPGANEWIKSAEQLEEKKPIKASSTPLVWDVWIYRMVVFALGVAMLLAVLGAIGLAVFEKDIPQTLVAIGSAAVGALAGLLAPPPTGRE